jgi:hypothetical protein
LRGEISNEARRRQHPSLDTRARSIRNPRRPLLRLA